MEIKKRGKETKKKAGGKNTRVNNGKNQGIMGCMNTEV
jgi:hypothetical protein